MVKLKVYLVGSIQDDKAGGMLWRDRLEEQLKELGFDALNPCTAECNISLGTNVVEQKKMLENLKRGGAWEKYDEVMSNIRKSDIICVNQSAFLVLLYDHTKHYGGTVHEIVEAWQKHIPILTVSYSALTEFNDWILSLLRENMQAGGKIFPNFKQLLEHIEHEYKDYIKSIKEIVPQ